MDTSIQEKMKQINEDIEMVITYYENHSLTNEQAFLTWLDELNRLSVKY